MSKNKKQKVEVKPKENMEVKKEMEVVSENNKDDIEEISESVKDIKNLITEINKFVKDYSKYHDILPLEPIKQKLSKLQKREDLESSDKIFLSKINGVIYTKTLKQGERIKDYEGKFVFRKMQDKINRLEEVANGYGDYSIVTTINDLQEDAFYCMREQKNENKMNFEDALKVTNVGGAYLAEKIQEDEAIDIRKKYEELEQNQDEEDKKIYISNREFINEPEHAKRYYTKICNNKIEQAKDKNKKLDEIEEQEEAAVGI